MKPINSKQATLLTVVTYPNFREVNYFFTGNKETAYRKLVKSAIGFEKVINTVNFKANEYKIDEENSAVETSDKRYFYSN